MLGQWDPLDELSVNFCQTRHVTINHWLNEPLDTPRGEMY